MASKNLRLAELASNVDANGAYTLSAGIEVYTAIGELPLSGNSAGNIAFIDSSDQLFIFSGEGWYNIGLVNQTPTITQGADASYIFATDGTPIVITLIAEDPEGIPLTWSYAVTSGSLGSTATVSQNNNQFTITPSTNPDNEGSFSLTFTASDGVNVATSISSFALAFLSTIWKNVDFSMDTSSTSGLGRDTIIDESITGATITANGDAHQVGWSPLSPGAWSAYFDGTGDYLEIAPSADFEFDGDFTIEGWMYFTNVGDGSPQALFSVKSGTSEFDIRWYTSRWQVSQNTGSGTNIGTTPAPVEDTWTHVACVRNGSNIKVYVNGVATGAGLTNSNTLGYSSVDASIGGSNTGGNLFNGNLFDVRVVKGTAVYTSDFTPPTILSEEISGTSLLACRENRFIDSSANSHVITIQGDVKIQSFFPSILVRSDNYEYTPALYGGSGFFDGSGTDQLVTPSSADYGFDTGDFTIEFWYNPTNKTRSYPVLISNGNYGSNKWQICDRHQGDGPNEVVLKAAAITSVTLKSTTQIKNGRWYHVAVVRNGSTFTLYMDGVSEDTHTSSNSIDGGGNETLYVGMDASQGTSTNFHGHISDLRVTKSALYTTNFSVPTSPIGAGSSILYLPFDNPGVYDKTGKTTINVLGDTVTSDAQIKYTDTSVYFDGSADYLSLSPINIGVEGDFTIESWIYAENLSSERIVISSDYASGENFELFVSTGGYVKWRMYTTSSSADGTETISAQTWNHVAWTRSGDQNYIFVNGVLSSTTTSTTNAKDMSEITIGGRGTTNPWYGYIEGLQIISDYAKYTTGFTVPPGPQGFDLQTTGIA